MDVMFGNLELFFFVKMKVRKIIIEFIIEKRFLENFENEWLVNEKK